MKAIHLNEHDSQDVARLTETEESANKSAEALAELEQAEFAALETYSKVHRGSGYKSIVSTHLFEEARDTILEDLGSDKERSVVVFCTPRRAEMLIAHLKPENYRMLSSHDVGLPLGVRVLAVDRKALPKGVPIETGGGTARLVSPGWVVWAKAPDKFEAGTPAIINVIAFAKALQLLRHFGKDTFRDVRREQQTATGILYHDDLEQYAGRELLKEIRRNLIGRDVIVPTAAGLRRHINLDNAASTPTFVPVWNAVWQAWRQPEPVQQEIVQEVMSICADVLRAPLAAYDVLFTSNTTEAVNLVAESLQNESEPGVRPVVVNTIMEHNSNELPWRMLSGVTLIRLPVDAEGFVNPSELETLLRKYNQKERRGKKGIKLVALSGASNVLGVCNDLAEISRIVHRYGARLLVDAAQLVAHRKVDIEGWGIDYLAFSAHKTYAPFGSGVLLARKGLLHFSPAEMKLIRMSGEENVGGIAALGKALLLLQRIGLDVIQEEEQALTKRILFDLVRIPGITTYGIKDPDSTHFDRKGGVIVFRVDGLLADQVARELAEQGGIGVRYGCHCAHMLIKRILHIPLLLELLQGLIVKSFPQLSLPGLTRVSLGIENTAEEIETFLRVLGEIVRNPHRKAVNPFAPVKTDVQQQTEDFARDRARRIYTQHGETAAVEAVL